MRTVLWWGRFWRLAYQVVTVRRPTTAQQQQIRERIEELRQTKPH